MIVDDPLEGEVSSILTDSPVVSTAPVADSATSPLPSITPPLEPPSGLPDSSSGNAPAATPTTPNSDSNFLSLIQGITNNVLYDEQGQPIPFEDTPEGFAKREQMLIDAARREAYEQLRGDLLRNPSLMSQYTQRNVASFADYDPSQANDSDKVSLIAFSLRERGIDDDTIKMVIDKAVTDKTVDTLFDKHLTALRESEAASREQLLQQSLAEQEQARALQQQAQAELVNVLNQGKLNVAGSQIDLPLVITTNRDGNEVRYTRQQLYDYITKPAIQLENGDVVSGYQYDKLVATQSETVSDVVYDAIKLLTGNELSVDQQTKSINEKYEALRNKIGAYNKGIKPTAGAPIDKATLKSLFK
jgi:hypothetical protein